MLDIIICEDNSIQLQQMVGYIEKYALIEELPVQVKLATINPHEVIQYIQDKSKEDKSFYFIDIELQSNIDGIELACQIRQNDPESKIVFVTAYSEFAPLTFKYHIEALDYIVKSSPEQVQRDIVRTIRTAYDRLFSDHRDEAPRFVIEMGARTKLINTQDINHFETLPPHRVRLVGPNLLIDFYDTLTDIANRHPHFVRVHRSYVANLQNVRTIDRKHWIILFKDGSQIPLARSRAKDVEQRLQQLQSRN